MQWLAKVYLMTKKRVSSFIIHFQKERWKVSIAKRSWRLRSVHGFFWILLCETGADLHISQESQLANIELLLMSVIECWSCCVHSRISDVLYKPGGTSDGCTAIYHIAKPWRWFALALQGSVWGLNPVLLCSGCWLLLHFALLNNFNCNGI